MKSIFDNLSRHLKSFGIIVYSLAKIVYHRHSEEIIILFLLLLCIYSQNVP
jgi:hypothetical protein